jgi:Ca2+-binding EF-hand superfamily protein
MKKKNLSVEKAYKSLDPDDRKIVMKYDFINECYLMGFEFTEEELEKIFEYISQVGTEGTTSTD